ncbi:MAG: hypothetical protein J3Q66DRAFT_295609, partial [Benniella sp.]
MQNSDDACAKGVEIVFETASPDSNETVSDSSTKIKRVIFKNNGMDFRQEDWDRLKKIAEGNPDESKIGVFGVGFYSLFSICEEPFISSGKECMAFYWKNDQLYVKPALIPEGEQQEGSCTTFLLDLREPVHLFDMDGFARFLARSLGFTDNLREVTVYLDHHLLFRINKDICESQPMVIPDAMHKTSPQNLFTLKSVDLLSVKMKASKWSQENHAVEEIFLRTASGKCDVRVPNQFGDEMERTAGKRPPRETTLQLLYIGHGETEASTNNTIFRDLLPFPEQGKIFVGFPTHQTTGFCGHVAGRFIPTVERESLDFVDKYIKVWNRELLSVVGLLSRMIYEDELGQIGNIYNSSILSGNTTDEPEDEDTAMTRERLENRALHALRAFQFHESTPNPRVGSYIDDHFFKMSKSGLSVLSSHGVKELDKVRIPDPAMLPFLKNLPVIPTSVYSASRVSIDRLEKAGKIQRICFGDVLEELKSRTLTGTQMVAMLRWWMGGNSNSSISDADIKAFFNTTLVYSGDSARPLSTFRWFVNPELTPVDMPLPPETLPYDITKNFTEPGLHMISAKWQELDLHEWTRYIIEEPDFETSSMFAEKVLLVLSRGWNQMPEVSQKAIVALLANKKCIPTNYGMKTPNESYFDTVTLFPDLPVMVFTTRPHDRLLINMGARQIVELRLVFDRLVNAGSWDHMQLVKYLASVRNKLSQGEIEELRSRPIFTKKDLIKHKPTHPKCRQSTAAPSAQFANRCLANTLYTPTETHIALGLPVIEWKASIGNWNEKSDEADLLFELGLERSPRMNDLLRLAASPNERVIRTRALQYFLDNVKGLYSGQYDPSVDIAFLPTTDGSFQTPLGCFTNKNCSIMDFPILHQDLRMHITLLCVEENPSSDKLLDKLLKSPPTSKAKAQQVFEYLLSVQASFLDNQWKELKKAKFIPLDDTGMTMVDPQSCYFYREDLPYRDLLITIDFGQSANQFLKACGVKEEPSPVDLAQLVARSPGEFLKHEGVDRYWSILRRIAIHLDAIKSNESLLAELRRSPFLLGEITIQNEASGSSESMADGRQVMNMGQVVKYELALASDIYLVDDSVLQQIFTPLCAPTEDLLESLYESLGSTWISEKVEEIYEPIGQPKNTDRTYALQARIEERAPLLLSIHSTDRLTFNLDWLTTNLKVLEVPRIQLHLKFIPTGVTKSEETTVCIVKDRKEVHYLMIKDQAEMDYFDIGDALAKLLLKRKRLNDSIWWTNLLLSSLENLKRKGFQVHRILNAK